LKLGPPKEKVVIASDPMIAGTFEPAVGADLVGTALAATGQLTSFRLN
jgi:hypothetical protein